MVSRDRGVKARIAGEYQVMALAAVKGVYSTGSQAVGILRLFSLNFPSASLCDCVISTVCEVALTTSEFPWPGIL
jgi:hypothetical protein